VIFLLIRFIASFQKKAADEPPPPPVSTTDKLLEEIRDELKKRP